MRITLHIETNIFLCCRIGSFELKSLECSRGFNGYLLSQFAQPHRFTEFVKTDAIPQEVRCILEI